MCSHWSWYSWVREMTESLSLSRLDRYCFLRERSTNVLMIHIRRLIIPCSPVQCHKNLCDQEDKSDGNPWTNSYDLWVFLEASCEVSVDELNSCRRYRTGPLATSLLSDNGPYSNFRAAFCAYSSEGFAFSTLNEFSHVTQIADQQLRVTRTISQPIITVPTFNTESWQAPFVSRFKIFQFHSETRWTNQAFSVGNACVIHEIQAEVP
jgi:hypothetical protein